MKKEKKAILLYATSVCLYWVWNIKKYSEKNPNTDSRAILAFHTIKSAIWPVYETLKYPLNWLLGKIDEWKNPYKDLSIVLSDKN